MGIEIQEADRGSDEGSESSQRSQPIVIADEPTNAVIPLHRVTVIERQGDAVLVQWIEDGAVKRAWMPQDGVESDQAGTYAAADVGIPYGDTFDVRDFTITQKQITDALHGAGLWTWAEIRANPQKVQGVIHKLSDELLRAVFSTAQVREKQNNG